MVKRYLIASIALFAFIAWLLFQGSSVSAPDISSAIQRNLERELRDQPDGSPAIMNRLDTGVWSVRGKFLFVFNGNQLVSWSTNSFSADISWSGNPGEHKFVKTLRGDFVATTHLVDDGHVLISVIPLVERFRITNRYLGPAWNKDVFGGSRPNLFALPTAGSSPITIDGSALFHVAIEDTRGAHSPLSLVMISIAVLALSALLFLQIRALHRRRSYGPALLILVVGFGALRGIMITFGFPGDWLAMPVFDSSTFASSSFNPTIGDLLFNSLYVLAFSVYLFMCFGKSRMLKAILRTDVLKQRLVAVMALALALFGFLFPFLFFETIFHNSFITLDWTQSLDVDAVRTIAFVSVVAGTATSFLFCHVWISLAIHLSRNAVAFFLGAVIPAAGIFFLYYFTQDHNYLITLVCCASYIAALYITGWHRSLSRVTGLTYLYLVLGIAFYSLQAGFSIRQFTEERTARLQYRFGQSFLIERDELGEYLLQQAATAIAADPFIQSSISSPFLSRSSVRSKVKQVYLNTYFDRYDIQIHMFSPAGEPLDSQTKPDFGSFVLQYEAQASGTAYKGIYFVNQSDALYAKQYVVVVPILRQGRALGYITLVLSLKKVVPQSVFPELLVDNRFAEIFKADQYSYAIFQERNVVSSFGPFNYESDFNTDWLAGDGDEAEKVVAGKRHIIVEGDAGRNAVVTSNLYPDFFLASNLAFWIMVGIAVVTFGFFIHAMIRIRSFRLNYATRIQIIVFLAFIVPLVVISATTLTWTSSTAEERLRQDFGDRARRLAEQVSPEMASVPAPGDQRRLEDFLIEGARLSGIDASIYSRTGKLLATNQLQIFDNLIVSNLINPLAFERIKANQTAFIEEEQIGKLRYNNAYHLLRSPESGETLGILSVPFFDSGYSLERSRIVILSNVMIAFTIILLLFTLLSFVATRWLTFPLRMITRSLSRTTLKEENTPLHWKSNDEIGLMVSEYNKMVVNLERSKLELARRQKESAWREIAQQVAHEIKNPLTPIKLSLQQLESLIVQNGLSKEKAEQTVKNLLVQVEILNDIATSFSSFARMPAPILERIEALSLLDKTVALYAGHPMGKVILSRPSGSVWIMGDHQLLSRIFSNLILNGLQSGDTGITVTVKAVVERDELLITFSDNGSGIDQSLAEKVFQPHFTTKKSGSGLGLAISKQGVEQSGGRIWFESGSSGTTFFIALPVKEKF